MRIDRFAGLAAVALAASTATAAVVVPGNLVIIQLGDGTTALADAGAVVKLRELTPAGVAVQTATLPSTGSTALTINGTAVSEGFLTLHDGHIGVAGYVADAGTPSLPGTASSAVPRHMSGYSLSQDLAGAPAYDATTTTLHSGGNMRSAVVSTTAGGFYSVGAGTGSNGVNYLVNGASGASGTQIVGLNQSRMVDIVGGNIYFSAQATSRGIYTVPGLPTSSASATNFVPTPAAGNGGTAVALNAFWLSDDLQTAYIADTQTTLNPGVKKYVFNSGTSLYELAYSMNTDYDGAGPATGEARYLTVDDSGVNPLIYVVSSDGTRLLSLLDLGSAATSEATLATIALADANTSFRGVVVTPVPEPAAIGLGFLGGLLALARRRRRI